jgi:hypothetical protein
MDTLSNSTFITSKEAATLTGYVADYITRQCRAGKIKSKQEGRVWIIDKESLLEYFAEEEKRKEANAQALARSREEEYREAQKVRKVVEPVPSPYTPAPVPFEWREEEYRAPVRGSFTALAMTLLVLSAGLYLSDKQIQRGAFSVVQAIGDRTITFVGSGAYQTLGLRSGERHVLTSVAVALPDIAPLQIETEEAFAKLQKVLPSVPEAQNTAVRKPVAFVRDQDVSHLLPNVVGDTGAMVGGSLKHLSDFVLGIYMDGVDGWVRTTPEIPPRIISFVGDVGYTLASLSNSAPTRVATSMGGFENFALGVVGHVALAYDTTKETLIRAYHYAPGAKLALLRQAERKEVVSQEGVATREDEIEKVKLGTLVGEALLRLKTAPEDSVASASASGGLSFFEGLALNTYKAIHGLFSGIGNSVGGMFVREDAGTAPELAKEESGDVQASSTRPAVAAGNANVAQRVTSSAPSSITNEYYTITTTGVSKEYVEERIKLHLSNLDDRVGDRIDAIDTGGGGGGGSGSVTSLDVSGGTTGLSFAGGPITSSGTLTMSGTLAVANGGTGITTAPTYGQLLLGNSLGGYTLVATSSLGISGGSGTPGGADGEVQFNQGGTLGAESAFSYASTTNTLLVTSGVIQSSSGIFRGDDQYHQIILHNGGNNSDYIEWGDTLAAGGGHRFYTGGATPTLRVQIADDGTYLEGPVGIGSTSPSTRLSVQGNQYTSGSAFFGGALTATSSVTFSSYTSGALGVTGTGALYTFSTSSWSFASSTLLSDTNIWSGVNNFINRLSSGSSSPFAKFTVHANNGENYTNNTLFAIGSSTASATSTLFSVSNKGNTTIGNAVGSAVSLNLVADVGNTVTLNLTNGNTSGLSYNASGNNLQLFGPAGTALAVTGNAGDIALTGRAGSSSAGGTLALTAGAANGTDVAGASVTVSAGAATGNATGGNITFRTSVVGSTGATVQALSERLRIANTGNIGIASTSPFANLSVHANNGGTNTTLFAIGSSTASATTTLLSVTNTGQLLVADGSNTLPAFGFVNEPGLGFYRRTTNVIQVGRPAAPTAEFVTSGSIDGIRLNSGSELGWNSTGLGGGGTDTYLGRIAAGVVGIGSNGNQGSITGTLVAESIGLGTTSPYAQLSIVATSTNGVGAPTTLFAIASTTGGTATSTLFSVNNAGTIGTYGALTVPTMVSYRPSGSFDASFNFGFANNGATTPNNNTFRIANNGSAFVEFGVGGTTYAGLSASGLQVLNTGYFGFTGGAQNLMTTSISRVAEGVVGIGTGPSAAQRMLGTLVAERIGLGTTTPYAQLAIVATSTNGLGAPTTLFAIASTTAGTATSTHFVVTNTGYVGIGTDAPTAQLMLVGSNGTTRLQINSESTNRIALDATSGIDMRVAARTFDFEYNNDLTVLGTAFAFGQSTTNMELNGTNLNQSMVSIVGEFAQSGTASADGLLVAPIFTSLGDGTTGAGNNIFRAANGTDTKFVINTNGLVGIGTTSPYAKLSIHGINGETNTTLFAVASSTASATTTLFSVANTGAISGASGTFTVSSTGYASGARFTASDVNTAFLLTNLVDIGTGITGGSQGGMRMYNDARFGWSSTGALGTVDVAFARAAAGTVRVANSGGGSNLNGWLVAERIGLGTTSPYAQLSIVATSTNGLGAPTTLFAIASTTAGTATTTLFSVANTGAITGVGNFSVASNGHVSAARLISSGYLISTANGTNMLIGDPVTSGGGFRLTDGSGDTGTNSGYYIYNAYTNISNYEQGGIRWNSNVFEVGTANTGTGVARKVVLKTAGTTALTVDTNQSIGIGTTTPWRVFSVAGTAAFSGLTNDSTGYYVCLNTTSGELATSTTACGASSERFKENVEDITYGLDAVMALKPVSFDYKEQYLQNAPRQLGFIAEEVDLVIPELVARNAEGTIQGLDYPKFTSVLVKAIQDVVNIQGTFRNALVAWFASSTNEIGDFVANRIRTTELCVKDASGETCITREVLDELLAGVGATGSEGPNEEPPAEDPPVEEPPAEEPPAEEPSTEEPPAEEPPAEDSPVEEPPAEQPPTEEPPAEEPPAEEVASETTI